MAAISAWATSGQALSSIGPDLSGNPQRNTAGCDKAETQRKQCKWWNPACHAEPAPGSALTGLLQTLSSASASYSPYQENSFPQVTNIYSAYWFYLKRTAYPTADSCLLFLQFWALFPSIILLCTLQCNHTWTAATASREAPSPHPDSIPQCQKWWVGLSDVFYFPRNQQVGCHSRGMFVEDRNCLSKSHPLLLRVCRSLQGPHVYIFIHTHLDT